MSSNQSSSSSGGSGFFSMLGSLGSSAISGLFSNHQQYRSYKYAKKLQQHQYNLQQRGYLEGPTNARKGLESAGYNPILAVNGGSNFAGSVAGGSPIGANGVNVPDFGSNMVNAYRAYKLEKQNMDNQTAQTEANVGLANAQAENAIQQAITEETKRYDLQMDAMMKDAQRHSIDTKLPYEVRKLNEEIYNVMQDSELKRAIASIQSYDAETRRISANANASSAKTAFDTLELNKNISIQEQKYRDDHPIYNWADRWTSVAGRILGGAGLAASGYSQVKNSITNAKDVNIETSSFDRNGTYKGHTRQHKRRR